MVGEEIIKGCEIFDVFPEEMIREVASFGIPLNYNKGQILFNFDDPANNFLILVSGRVEVLTTKGSLFIPVHTVKPGEAFALSAMITGRFVSAARAVEDSKVCALPVGKMNRILEKDYKVGFHFMKRIAALVSGRILKVHYQLEAIDSGYR
jgi:CRP-like cAMP-binding protein